MEQAQLSLEYPLQNFHIPKPMETILIPNPRCSCCEGDLRQTKDHCNGNNNYSQSTKKVIMHPVDL